MCRIIWSVQNAECHCEVQPKQVEEKQEEEEEAEEEIMAYLASLTVAAVNLMNENTHQS